LSLYGPYLVYPYRANVVVDLKLMAVLYPEMRRVCVRLSFFQQIGRSRFCKHEPLSLLLMVFQILPAISLINNTETRKYVLGADVVKALSVVVMTDKDLHESQFDFV